MRKRQQTESEERVKTMTGLEQQVQALQEEVEMLAKENRQLMEEVRELKRLKQRKEHSCKAKFLLG